LAGWGGGAFFAFGVIYKMSLPLIDLRAKITIETDAVLEAVHRSTGKDKSEVVRDVLNRWAMSEIHAAIVLNKILKREGISAASEGDVGQ
jgi:hypothetical protein